MIEYTHIQSTPSAAWTVNHNFGNYPVSDVIMSVNGSRTTMMPLAVEHVNGNQAIIRFSAAYQGSVRLVGGTHSVTLTPNNDRSDSIG